VSQWGTGAFENDSARDWFYLVEEAVDPGDLIASALDDALAEAGDLEVDAASAAIAAAELSAACAGAGAEDLPDQIRRWAGEHPHEPHAAETDHAVGAVERVRAESELRQLWDDELGSDNAWLGKLDDLIERLKRSGSEGPTALRP
jgi:hypothetical protein